MKVGQIASFGTKKGDKIRGQPKMMEERVERDLEHPFPRPGMKPSITSGLALGRANPRIQRAKCKIQGHLWEQKSSRTLRMKQDPLDRTLLETVLSTVLRLQMLATPTHPASYPNISCSKDIILSLDNGLYVRHNSFSSTQRLSQLRCTYRPVLHTDKAVPIPIRVPPMDTPRQ